MTACEVCARTLEGPILDLGMYPLCDDLQKIESDQPSHSYHQKIQLCSNCRTAIQLHQVPKEELFKKTYHYRARLTRDVLDGMQKLVGKVQQKVNFKDSQKVVLDIGCNDGSLLSIFKQNTGAITIGVDPTDAIQEVSSDVDFPLQGFFDESMVTRILEITNRIDVVTFTNVFAHIENLTLLCQNLRRLITDETIVVIENHYLGSVLSNFQFDTFYHEHPRTYSATSFVFIAEMLGLKLDEINFPERYGGNIQVTLVKSKLHTSNRHLEEIIQAESSFLQKFAQMQNYFDEWRINARAAFQNLIKDSTLVVGKSLPGRAVMLINALNITEDEMPYLFELSNSPKVGHYVPGTKIQVLPDNLMSTYKPDTVVIWAWHIQEEVLRQLRSMSVTDNLWVPLPVFKKL